MLSNEIKSVHAALGALAGQIPEEQWAVVKLCRDNLLAAANSAAQMEQHFNVPEEGKE